MRCSGLALTEMLGHLVLCRVFICQDLHRVSGTETATATVKVSLREFNAVTTVAITTAVTAGP